MNAPGRYWIVRYPESQGAVVARMDTAGETRIPEVISEYDSFVVQSVSDRSALVRKEIDQSGLSAGEKRRLRSVYPTDL